MQPNAPRRPGREPDRTAGIEGGLEHRLDTRPNLKSQDAAHLRRLRHIPIPPLRDYCRLYEDLGEACGVYPRPKTVAVALNTSALNDAEANAALKEIEAETGLPASDPVRYGAEPFLEMLKV